MVSSAARTRVTLAAQALALRSAFPTSTPIVRNSRLLWTHVLQPAPASLSYGVRLEAQPYTQAQVFVTSPELEPDSKGRLPHVYDNGSLCLNRAREWKEDQLFIDTCIPWVLEWLFHYELWLSDHIWRGDGLDASDRAAQERILHPYSVPVLGGAQPSR
jgi:hypothetical protein